MDLEAFMASLSGADPPAVSSALVALWHDANGDWSRAHEVAQDIDDAAGPASPEPEAKAGSWVHAYLHRKEGDMSNAGYWYRRAGKRVATGSLEEEWLSLVTDLLSSAQ
jgi:hypothetical protein